MSCIEAADVKRRIRFSIAEPLSFAETDFERQIFGLHAGENIVASAIENAGNALNHVSGQTLAQGLYDGYPASHRRFKIQPGAESFGESRELETMRREHRLVGRDHRDAAREGGSHRVESDSISPADQFDENVDAGRGGKLRRACEITSFAEIDAAVALAARAIGDQRAFPASLYGEPGPPPLKKSNEAGPNHTEAGNPQTDRLGHSVVAPPSADLVCERPCARVATRAQRSTDA